MIRFRAAGGGINLARAREGIARRDHRGAERLTRIGALLRQETVWRDVSLRPRPAECPHRCVVLSSNGWRELSLGVSRSPLEPAKGVGDAAVADAFTYLRSVALDCPPANTNIRAMEQALSPA